jgi:hypothetical protein
VAENGRERWRFVFKSRIEGSKSAGSRGSLTIFLAVGSENVAFETNVTIPGTGNLAQDIDRLRRDLQTFAGDLAKALDQPLQFG